MESLLTRDEIQEARRSERADSKSLEAIAKKQLNKTANQIMNDLRNIDVSSLNEAEFNKRIYDYINEMPIKYELK